MKEQLLTKLKQVGIRARKYVRGYIVDERMGHHKSVFLPTWHKAVRNRETTINISPIQKDSRRMRSWD